MTPVAMPAFVEPAPWSTYAFVALVLALCAAFVVGVHRAGRLSGEPPAVTRLLTLRVTRLTVAWLAVTAGVSASGVLETPVLPPPALGFLFGSVLVPAVVALSPLGTRLLALPLWALIGFQVFRLPLELILHRWAADGTLPPQMTYDGDNFDILTGVLALPAAALAAARPALRWPIWAWNVLGFALLANVSRVAVLSSPIPFRTYLNEPPVLLAFHAPYSWIVPFCVGGALLGHILVFRALRRPRP
jgi:hypothetical protein